MRWQRLFTQPFLLSVPPGHRLAGRESVALSEAAEEEFVAMTPDWGLRAVTDQLCRAAGFSPRVAFEAHELLGVAGLVGAGLGVAIVPAPDHVPDTGLGDDLLRLTDEGAYRDVGLALVHDRRLLPSAELFRDYVVAHPWS